MQRDIFRFEHLALFMLLIMATTFNGCALFQPTYGPKNIWLNGYDDIQVDKNTYRVRYYGKGLTQETAERYLLYRCAELTVAQGYDYFVVTDQAADAETTSEFGNTISTEMSGKGIKTETTVESTNSVSTSTTYNPVKTIKVFKGKKPEDNFKAYDGREVTATLAPKIEFRDSTDAAR